MSGFLKPFFLLLVAVILINESEANGIVADGQGKRLLVLLDNYGIRETHSIFFKSLKDRGFQITYKAADDADLTLSKYSEYIYDHLILFSPNVVEFGGNVTTKSIIDFIDAGGNVLVAANSEITEPIKEIAAECGVEFSDEGSYVIDRFNSDIKDDGRNTLIISDAENLINNKVIVGESRTGAGLLYRGIGMTADPENPLVMEILTASTSAYVYKPDEPISDYPHAVGKSTLLISGQQARNNARVVFIGSLDFFSNEFFEANAVKSTGPSNKMYQVSGNEQLSKALTQWVFKEVGVIRVAGVTHHRVGEKSSPSEYTIKQDIVYSIKIEEIVDGKWVGFRNNDVQLEFVRLDPFVRTTLKNNNGNFNVQFQIPDVYGIFKFVVDYNRVGYTHLFSTTQVSVRPLTHTQYDRFISAAYPYYVSSFSMMIAVFFFTFIQLYHHDAPSTNAIQQQK
jgi:oligosaccharyltransferase complex subunit beta